MNSIAARAKTILQLLQETLGQWSKDHASRLAASLAFYTLLSIAPLIVLSIAVAGAVLGEQAARGQLAHEIGTVVGPQAGKAIEALIENARTPTAGIVSSIVGGAVLLFGASNVFGELQATLNQIWNVKQKPGRGLRGMLRDRFFSVTMVMGVAFLMLVSLIFSALLSTVMTRFEQSVDFPVLWQAINLLAALALTTVLFSLIFKVVPDAKIAWRDVWVGGFVTALCFTLGKGLLAWYVGRSATTSPFGAAGSLVALTIWVYYSAQILFLGAEFTQVYASHFGSRIEPADNAMPAGAAAPAEPRPRPASGEPPPSSRPVIA